jgi:mannose-6-phosphate isomerase-like protein (cupin superfamily)
LDLSFEGQELEPVRPPAEQPQQHGPWQGSGHGSWSSPGQGAWQGPGQGAWSGHGPDVWQGSWHGAWPDWHWQQPWGAFEPWYWHWPWYGITPYGAGWNPQASQSPGTALPFTRETGNELTEWKDYGGQPFVVDIEDAAERNPLFRLALWTGKHLQVTLMSIGVGEEIGLEVHPETDQFLRIEQGRGVVQMGDSRDRLNFVRYVSEDDAIMIPAGKWHNVINVGHEPLKLYSIYAPPEHPFGTVHRTKAEAEAAEAAHRMR